MRVYVEPFNLTDQRAKSQNPRRRAYGYVGLEHRLVYAGRVRMAKSAIQVGNKTVNLTPGMAVTVEVKTGKRRLIEYVLSPLLRVKNESLGER